jgi:hypothetical protein
MKNEITISNDHGVFKVNHSMRTISVPQSVEEGDYPQEVKDYFKIKGYYKQLNIL